MGAEVSAQLMRWAHADSEGRSGALLYGSQAAIEQATRRCTAQSRNPPSCVLCGQIERAIVAVLFISCISALYIARSTVQECTAGVKLSFIQLYQDLAANANAQGADV